MRILAIDPGLRHTAFAIHDDTLQIASLVLNPETTQRGPLAWARMARAVVERLHDQHFQCVVIEEPEQYTASRVSRDDVAQLSGVVGAIALPMFYHTSAIVGVRPKVWKGQVPKDVHNRRVLAKLTPAEHKAIDASIAPSLRHNMIDAIGIALWYAQQVSIREKYGARET